MLCLQVIKISHFQCKPIQKQPFFDDVIMGTVVYQKYRNNTFQVHLAMFLLQKTPFIITKMTERCVPAGYSGESEGGAQLTQTPKEAWEKSEQSRKMVKIQLTGQDEAISQSLQLVFHKGPPLLMPPPWSMYTAHCIPYTHMAENIGRVLNLAYFMRTINHHQT